MEMVAERVANQDMVAMITGVLNAVDHLQRAVLTDEERLAQLTGVHTLISQLMGLRLVLLQEAADAQVTEHARGLSLRSWLSHAWKLTAREAARLQYAARDLAVCPQVTASVIDGQVSIDAARAMTRTLTELPTELDGGERARAEETLLGYAQRFDSHALSQLGQHLVEVVAPQLAERLEAEKLDREEAQAQRDRYLVFSDTGQGSVLIKGSLPTLAAEPLMCAVDASAARAQALDALDPTAPLVTASMRRADGLLSMAHAVGLHRDAPVHGGDRPRIVITMKHADLRRDAVKARLLRTDQPIAAGDLRRLLCDADVLPAVLRGESEVLDVGRDHRLVTPAIRTALTVRDRGCVFPGCDRTHASCEAHHLVPWTDGGATALDNLVLLCRHHHRLIEPTRHPSRSRWRIQLGDDGIPEVLPPSYVDPDQEPRRQRFHYPLRS